MKKRKRKFRCFCIHILPLIIVLHLLLDSSSFITSSLAPSTLSNYSYSTVHLASQASDEESNLKPISADPSDLLAVESSPLNQHLSNAKSAPYEVQVASIGGQDNKSALASLPRSRVEPVDQLSLMFVPQAPNRELSDLSSAPRPMQQNTFSKAHYPTPKQSPKFSAGSSKNSKVNPDNRSDTAFEAAARWNTGEREHEFDRVGLSTGQYQRTRPSSETSWAQLLRQATDNNVLESLMVTNRSMVSLLCDTNDMLVKFRFRQPFNGSVITNLDRLSQCRLDGDGRQFYEMRVSLRDCGTRQEMPRLFINNIRIHYRPPDHQSGAIPSTNLSMDEDELKTIVCSYPIRPRAPPPPSGLPERIVEQPTQMEEPARLVHYEPLVLIASLLLVSLTVLSLTTTAYLVSRRLRKRRQRARGLGRDLDSTSVVSSRIYRNSPARVANSVVPPLIGLGKTIPSDARAPRRSQAGKRYPQMSSSDIWRSQGRSRVHKETNSTDSLTGRDPSVTTIEIPTTTVQLSPQASAEPRAEPTQILTNTLPVLKRVSSSNSTKLLETTKSYTFDKRTHSKTTRVAYESSSMATKAKVKPASNNDSQLVKKEAQFPKFGSLRSSLTSPREFKRLQSITEMFDEMVIERKVDSSGNEVFVGEKRLKPSKYQSQITRDMDSSERDRLRKLLNQDELFRSLVVESMDGQTFERKLRNNSTYRDCLKPATWDLFETILLDPEVGRARGLTERGTYTRWRKKTNSSASPNDGSQAHEDTQDREADAEVVAVLAATGSASPPKKQSESASLQHLDSLELAETAASRAYLETRVDLQPNDNNQAQGQSLGAETKSVFRVSQLNNARSNSGSSNSRGTMINVDSVTSFASGLNEFSTYTRSSIEHTRYHQDDEQGRKWSHPVTSMPESDDSLPYMDDKTNNNYEFIRQTVSSPKMRSDRPLGRGWRS